MGWNETKQSMGQVSKSCTPRGFLQTTIFGNQVVCKNPDAGIIGEGAFFKMAASIQDECLYSQRKDERE